MGSTCRYDIWYQLQGKMGEAEQKAPAAMSWWRASGRAPWKNGRYPTELQDPGSTWCNFDLLQLISLEFKSLTCWKTDFCLLCLCFVSHFPVLLEGRPAFSFAVAQERAEWHPSVRALWRRLWEDRRSWEEQSKVTFMEIVHWPWSRAFEIHCKKLVFFVWWSILDERSGVATLCLWAFHLKRSWEWAGYAVQVLPIPLATAWGCSWIYKLQKLDIEP